AGPVEVAAHAVEGAQCVHRGGEVAPVVEGARRLERFLQVRARRGEVSLAQARHAERLQRGGDALPVAELARDDEALLEVALRLSVTSHEEGELPRVEEGAAASLVALAGAGPGDGVGDERVPEAEEPPHD